MAAIPVEELVYQSDPAFLNRILLLPPESLRLLCPVCHAPLLFAPTWKRARELRVHPGIYCQVDLKHCIAMFELAPESE